ncbi:Glu/Leu/Phe/Val family dehydrogenase [Tindallia californiensis]|uniref:Glutamate dehydrogenase n=1 Tax=Tindallia californiensis TaxID=159292 RepID=A0A1H3LJU3_9FIRM|nr:Glu/Leu/Phe/Val dehydrogenase [Tindallia californiensis]SDY64653.1 glutamate dehydrogenase/glutamate dehydrogenase (NAD(P)+) [Tindallia californiensis]
MSKNPFQTALTTLQEAAKMADVEPNAIKMLSQPKRIFEFAIPMKMDNGELEIFTAYRVHYNDALGQVKNGLRFVPDLDLDTVKALGFWMTIKHAVGGIPAGGGKGGVRVDAGKLSEGELERLSRAYIRKLPMKGAWVDIPGADIGTSAKTMAWMLDEYEEINGFHSPAAINDKPAETSGTVGSMEATGTGAFFVTMEAVRDLNIPKGSTVAIQGFGNVGRIAARLLHKEGYKVVGVADYFGGVYDSKGIDIEKLEEHSLNHPNRSVEGYAGEKAINKEEVLELDCDILIPAAVQSVIHEENADKIKAKLIMEAANGPVTPGAEKMLQERNIHIVPDVLTNCGSAIVCSFERTQGLTDSYWDIETINSRLKEQITKAYRETMDTAQEKDTSMRNAAWINALQKVSKSMKARGWI